MVCNLAVEMLGDSGAARATFPLDKTPRLGGMRRGAGPVSRGREQASGMGKGYRPSRRLK
jgi:hypothetical protein